MSYLNTSIVQFNIEWKNKEANFSKIKEMISDLQSDLIVLPEMFQTGFCVDDVSLAETIDGETIAFLIELSIEKDACIVGSFLCNSGGSIVNRFIAVSKGEIIHYYDKIHLFKMGDEHKHIAPGDGVSDFELNGFKIRPLICYDLRFPYASFNSSNYDILMYVANWPSQRIAHWDALLAARAIENQAFVIACNRVGEQDGHFYPGHSSAYSPTGEQLEHAHKEEVIEVKIEKILVHKTREKLPFLKDRVEY
jgi:predicted amidohydrolase